ncbi:MAG: FtsX-like permease family protein [Huintestinicola sp.]
MKNTLALNTLRSIKRFPGRFTAIMAIIAIGCAFFSGVKAACPDMKNSAWDYYNKQSLADIQLKSTLGFDDEDADILMESGYFDSAYAGYSADLFIKGSSGDSAVKVMSYSEDYPLNKLYLTEGRLPESADECVADSHPKAGVDIKIGDKITLFADESSEVSDVLSRTEYTVVGLTDSPLYVSFDRGATTIGNGTLYAFIYLPEENFAYDCPTDIYLRVSGADAANVEPFSEKYDSIVAEAEDYIEGIAAERLVARSDVIRSDAEEELSEARTKLADAEKEYTDGKEEYNKGYKEYSDAYDTFSENKTQYDEAYAEYEQSVSDLEEAKSNIDALEYTCPEIDKYLETYKDKYIKVLPSQLLDAIRNYQEIYDANYVEAQITELLAVYIITDPEKDPVTKENAYAAIYALNTEVKNAVEGLRAQADANKAALDAAGKQLEETKALLDEYESELKDSKHTLDDAKKELDEAETKLSDAKTELSDAEAELEESLSDGEWYVRNRGEFNPGCLSFGEDAERVDAIAAVFPLFFILVAALVCCTTMSRMVEEERTQAGTLKALGFSSFSIIMQYVLYAAAASVIGSVIGTVIGFQLLPNIIFDAYGTMYNYPYFYSPFMPMFALGCLGVSLLCTCLSAVYTAASELTGKPAALIRPKAPKNGKRIFLERITFLWKRMSFSHKVTFRNLLRYKSRFFMTLIGIAGCTALLLTAYGLKSAIACIADKQYNDIFIYDALAIVDSGADDTERNEINNFLDSSSVKNIHMNVVQENVTVYSDSTQFDCYLLAPESTEEMKKYIILKDRKSGEPIPLDGSGAVINEKLARLLDVSVGDMISVDSSLPFTVSGICENYTYNYVYMTMDMYNELFGESKTNMILMEMEEEPDESMRTEFSSGLIAKDGVISVSFLTDGASTFRKLVSSLNLIVAVIIGFAGALAFVILYNLVSININERIRELATIKVLGFFDGEVSAYVYRENTISAFIGIVVGLVLGIFLEKFVVRTAEVDVVMFSPDIELSSFVLAALTTAFFAVLVNFFMYFRLKKIDMAASMKAIE